ncbi:unnamed protein product [Discosporangium mesarthrocarpum]
MPKKGRQRGSAFSKAQRAYRWSEALREAKDDLARERGSSYTKGGGRDTSAPRISGLGKGTLAALLHQRARDDEATLVAPRTMVGGRLKKKTLGGAKEVGDKSKRCVRRPRSLASLCISQIGRDFLWYDTSDQALVDTFRLMPDSCLSRISLAASAWGNVADHNLPLVCGRGVTALWVRGEVTDKGAEAILPSLQVTPGDNMDPKPAVELGQELGIGPGAETDVNHAHGSEGSDPGVSSKALGSSVATTNSEGATSPGEGCRLVSWGWQGEQHASEAPKVMAVGGAGASKDEGWETAWERLDLSLQGCVALTSLDLTSRHLGGVFLKRLVSQAPSLRRLGIRGCLLGGDGTSVVCDHLTRLPGLEELDVSWCSWFCDLSLRRFTKALIARQGASAGVLCRRGRRGIPSGQDEPPVFFSTNKGAVGGAAAVAEPGSRLQDEAQGEETEWGGAANDHTVPDMFEWGTWEEESPLDTRWPPETNRASHQDSWGQAGSQGPGGEPSYVLHRTGQASQSRGGRSGRPSGALPRPSSSVVTGEMVKGWPCPLPHQDGRAFKVVCEQSSVTEEGALAAAGAAPGLEVVLEGNVAPCARLLLQ